MNQPRLLRTIKNLESLLLGNRSTKSALGNELGRGPKKQAHIFGLIAGPSQEFSMVAAVAGAECYIPGILYIVGDPIIGISASTAITLAQGKCTVALPSRAASLITAE